MDHESDLHLESNKWTTFKRIVYGFVTIVKNGRLAMGWTARKSKNFNQIGQMSMPCKSVYAEKLVELQKIGNLIERRQVEAIARPASVV